MNIAFLLYANQSQGNMRRRTWVRSATGIDCYKVPVAVRRRVIRYTYVEWLQNKTIMFFFNLQHLVANKHKTQHVQNDSKYLINTVYCILTPSLAALSRIIAQMRKTTYRMKTTIRTVNITGFSAYAVQKFLKIWQKKMPEKSFEKSSTQSKQKNQSFARFLVVLGNFAFPSSAVKGNHSN